MSMLPFPHQSGGPIPPARPVVSNPARELHPLLKAVRSTYRGQQRKPQFEPVCVDWIERYARAHPTQVTGPQGEKYVRPFLASLAARGEAPERLAKARESLEFLYSDVLPEF